MEPTTTGSPLPLTTTFVPPTECLNDFWLLSSSYNGKKVTWANLGPSDPKKCLPSGWAPSSYFSPGISCPSGWAMAGNYTTDGETVGTCCPIRQRSSLSFTIRTTRISKFPWFITEVCEFVPSTDITYYITYTNSDGVTKSAFEHRTSGLGEWNAYGIELRWRSTDLSTAPSTRFVSPTTSATAIATATPESVSDRAPKLSTGAKAGIGVGAALGGVLAILALGFLIFRGRKREWKDVNQDVNQVPGDSHPRENQRKPFELGSNGLFELNGYQADRPVELDGQNNR